MPMWGRRKAEVERLKTELAEQMERADRAEADREALRTACDRVREELGTADQRAQQLTAAHAATTAGLTKRAEIAEIQVARLRGQVTTKRVELATAQAAVEKAESRAQELASRLQQADAELLSTRRDAERVSAPLEERTDEATGTTAPDTAPAITDPAERMTEPTGQLRATQQQPTDAEQPPPITDSATDSATEQPGRSRSRQRQQPSRRRRGRPAKG
jgi:chromosome segregation ATPase